MEGVNSIIIACLLEYYWNFTFADPHVASQHLH